MSATATLLAKSRYAWGQCTDWVARNFAWINSAGNLGDARYWLQNAAAKGLPTGSTPKLGSVAVFQPGVEGAGKVGHVAVVTGVNPNGTFNVSEQNFPRTGVTTFRNNLKAIPGVGFIYNPATNSTVPGNAPAGLRFGTYGVGGQFLSFSEIMNQGGGKGIEGAISAGTIYLGQSALHTKLALYLVAGVLILGGLKLIGTPMPSVEIPKV